MRACSQYLGVAYLILCALPAQGADLAKIERTIAKEPKYQGKPRYGLLVIGPEAKFRVWLVQDGAVLYVDRDGSGDLTEPAKRVTADSNHGGDYGFKPGLVGPPDGKAKCVLRLSMYQGAYEISLRPEGRHISLAGFDGPGKLGFADRPKDAPIIHFLGPLTLQRFEPQPGSVSPHLKPQPLVRGQQNNLAFSLGTPGLGSGTFAKHPDAPAGSAEIRFPGGRTITAALQPDG